MPSGSRKGSRTRKKLKYLAIESALTAGKKKLGPRRMKNKGTKRIVYCPPDEKPVCRPRKYNTKKRKLIHKKQLEASKNLMDIEHALK